jgi:hypothetical protein
MEKVCEGEEGEEGGEGGEGGEVRARLCGEGAETEALIWPCLDIVNVTGVESSREEGR